MFRVQHESKIELASLPWPKEQTGTAHCHWHILSRLSSCRAKDRLKPIAYAKLLDLSKGSYLLFFICHERPLRRRSKWIQALITLQSEELLNSFFQHIIKTVSYFLSILPLNAVPVVGVDHVPTTASVTEAYTLSAGPPISVPVSGLIPVPKQLGSVSGQGLETPPTVSDHTVHMIVVANCWSCSTSLWLPIVHYRLHCLIP